MAECKSGYTYLISQFVKPVKAYHTSTLLCAEVSQSDGYKDQLREIQVDSNKKYAIFFLIVCCDILTDIPQYNTS